MKQNSAEQREYVAGRPAVRKNIVEQRPRCTELPKEFRPFLLNGSRSEAPYLSYLRRRGVSDVTVALYRMGYLEEGSLAGRVVIPSFDRHGSVNFWSARSIYPNETTFRYRLPHASKDIVSNEHMVDWTKPVYIVEGIFDEIAIGPQAIAVYGKFLPPQLALRLVQERPPMTFVCLDSDAWDESFSLLERLVGYDLPCSLVDLDGKDPGELGSESVNEAALHASSVTGSSGLLGVRI